MHEYIDLHVKNNKIKMMYTQRKTFGLMLIFFLRASSFFLRVGLMLIRLPFSNKKHVKRELYRYTPKYPTHVYIVHNKYKKLMQKL